GRPQPRVRLLGHRAQLDEEGGRAEEIAVENGSSRFDSRGLLGESVEEVAQRRRPLQQLSDPGEVRRESTDRQDVHSGRGDGLVSERATGDAVAESRLNQRRPYECRDEGLWVLALGRPRYRGLRVVESTLSVAAA